MAEGTNPANIEKWKIDGVDHPVGLRNVYVNEKGNLNVETSEELGNTAEKGNINIESMKNVQIKPGNKGDIRLQVDHLEEDSDGNPGGNELNIRILNSSVHTAANPNTDTDAAVALKLNTSEVTLTNEKSGTIENGVYEPIANNDLRETGMDLNFQSNKSANTKWIKAKVKASSIDLRCNAKGAGTGGGLAVQIASCDSERHENKFKIETDRLKDVMEGQLPNASDYSKYYNGEGGEGIEIGTFNSQFESLSTKELRRLALTEVFAVKRKLYQKGTLKFKDGVESKKDTYYVPSLGAPGTKAAYFSDEELTTQVVWPEKSEGVDAEFKEFEAKEADYQTQEDDSKDIKNTDQGKVLWIDIINAVLYLKSTEAIPNNDDVTDPDEVQYFSPSEE